MSENTNGHLSWSPDTDRSNLLLHAILDPQGWFAIGVEAFEHRVNLTMEQADEMHAVLGAMLKLIHEARRKA